MNEIQIFKKPDRKKLKAFEDNIKNPYMGVVYACEYGENVKIGSSGKPYTRLTTLIRNAERYDGLSIGAFAITPLHTNFRDNEKLLHSFFANSRVGGTELFSISLQQAIDEAEKLELRDDSAAFEKSGIAVCEGFKKIVTGEAFRGTELDVSAKPITQVSNKENVRGYLDQNLNVWLNAEDVAKGFGFTQVKNGVIYIRWNTVNSYLRSFGFSQLVGKDSYIPENMVYRLGFKANNETAQSFQEKLADEVLPSIRKTGGYMVAKQDDTPEMIMARAVLVAQETMKKQKQQLEQANERIALQDAQLKQQAPKVKYVDNVLQSVNTYTTTQMSKELGLREAKQLYNNLKEHGYMFKQSGQWLLTAKYSEKGYTKSRTYQFTRNDGSIGTSSTTVWTEKGRHWLHELQSNNKI